MPHIHVQVQGLIPWDSPKYFCLSVSLILHLVLSQRLCSLCMASALHKSLGVSTVGVQYLLALSVGTLL